MATYREDGPLYREDGSPVYREGDLRDDSRPIRTETVYRRRRGGGFLIGLLLVLGIIIFLLFYTGFWSANVTQNGALPKISVNTTPGVMPKVDLQSKQIVIGSKQESVAVPTVKVKNSDTSASN